MGKSRQRKQKLSRQGPPRLLFLRVREGLWASTGVVGKKLQKHIWEEAGPVYLPEKCHGQRNL